jgi:uncharacterized protein YbjT (DUF2867 family)
MRILVLGGYGFIGLAIARRLHVAGHEVTGVGRDAAAGPRLFPPITWKTADISALQSAADWAPLLGDIDVVVNAAGALQDGARDHLERIHHTSIVALVAACEAAGAIRIAQISAPGASTTARSDFMRSKARGDAAVKAGNAPWVVLRPGLVLGPNAYGGSALIRMMAALPVISVVALSDRRVQTVAMSDLTTVVLEVVEGKLPAGTDVDVMEPQDHPLGAVVVEVRQWLGLPTVRATLQVPPWCVRLTAAIADALGWLGWRSPMRTTAMRAIDSGVVGDAAPLSRLRGESLMTLQQTLDATPSTVQERWFARLYLLMPLSVALLSVFWLTSGLIAFTDIDRAAGVLPPDAMSHDAARGLVIAGAALDILLGLAILVRPFAKFACAGMLATTGAYLFAGSLLTPGLWLDPLGPFVKVLPAAMLALLTMALLEER